MENIYYCPGFYDDDEFKECDNIVIEDLSDGKKSDVRILYNFFLIV